MTGPLHDRPGDMRWRPDQIAALTAEVERLTAKLESDECNAGHKTLPLKLWDCPACGAARDAAIKEAVGLIQTLRSWLVSEASREVRNEADSFLATPAAERGRVLLEVVEAARDLTPRSHAFVRGDPNQRRMNYEFSESLARLAEKLAAYDRLAGQR